MKLKICGLRHPDNIEDLLDRVAPDYLGFIFYMRSARYAGRYLDPYFARNLEGAKKVGVFVDEGEAEMEEIVRDFGLDLVQLHGQESPETCAAMQAAGVKVIKVFSVGEAFDFAQLTPYEAVADYFLFDTRGPLPGGNGVQFDWTLLQNYPGEKPFFPNGGIGPRHAEAPREPAVPGLHAIDV
ncbi:MAG: phosphoribosylanthranilate isomerase, partial [Bacteroidetes bacterium]